MQEESITALRSELDIVKANKALELGDYVKVDPNAQNGVKGPNIVFSGANVHVTSGSGSTDDGGVALTGLGNLIVGYNEGPSSYMRAGSHNLMLGSYNECTSWGGLVAGYNNEIAAPFATVSGGNGDTSRGRSGAR